MEIRFIMVEPAMKPFDDALLKISFVSEDERLDIFQKIYDEIAAWPLSERFRWLLGLDTLAKMMFLQYLAEQAESLAVECILILSGDLNDVVRKKAQNAFIKNECSQKNQILRSHITHINYKTACFAIRYLSERGDFFILPVLWKLLENSAPVVQMEVLRALKLLANLRSIRVVLPLLESKDEKLRCRAAQTLTALNLKTKKVPEQIFLNLVKDPSPQIRQTALEGLETARSKHIHPLLLESALRDPDINSRIRSIRALGALMLPQTILPLLEIAGSDSDRQSRMTAEMTLSQFPVELIKKYLFPILEQPQHHLKNIAIKTLAAFAQTDKTIHNKLLAQWNANTTPAMRLFLMTIFKELPGAETEELLLKEVLNRTLLAFPAITALCQKSGFSKNPMGLKILQNTNLTDLIKQPVLNMFAKRGPNVQNQVELFSWLRQALKNQQENIRYLSLQTLRHYPFHQVFDLIYRHYLLETDSAIIEWMDQWMTENLRQSPLLLLETSFDEKKQKNWIPTMLRILKNGYWTNKACILVLQQLKEQPWFLLRQQPTDYIELGLAWLFKNLIDFDSVWAALEHAEYKQQFITRLIAKLNAEENAYFKINLDLIFKERERWNEEQRKEFYFLCQRFPDAQTIPNLMETILNDSAQNRIMGLEILKGLIHA